MCGIAGQIGREEALRRCAESGVYENMLDTLRRRGPDQDGQYMDENAVLLHARLAIVDLAGGRQPMALGGSSPDDVLVYNGELYNTVELREQLEGMGHRFTGYSDTEVVLHSYAAWGNNVLKNSTAFLPLPCGSPGESGSFLPVTALG